MALNKATLAEQIYQILRSDILNQTIKMGEKLTLQTLKERFEVSSTPIRDALTRLTEDGLVEYYSNIGVNVISLTKEDLIELYQFMGDLDSLSITYAATSSKREELLEKLTKNVEASEELANVTEMTPEIFTKWISYSDDFHLIFYDYCNNSRLKLAAEKLRSQLTIFSNMYGTKVEVQKQIDSMHSEILIACQQDDFDKAARLMKQHLNASLEYALSCI